MIMDKFEEKEEHRRDYRHPSHLSISIISGDSHIDTLCSLKDISLGGMSFQSGHELMPGERITVRFPESSPCCELYGKIIWSRRVNGVYEIGAEFPETDNRHELIEKIVSDVAHTEALRIAAA